MEYPHDSKAGTWWGGGADTGTLVGPREGIGVRDSGTLGHFQAASPLRGGSFRKGLLTDPATAATPFPSP